MVQLDRQSVLNCAKFNFRLYYNIMFEKEYYYYMCECIKLIQRKLEAQFQLILEKINSYPVLLKDHFCLLP